jgi:hypothetical protein
MKYEEPGNTAELSPALLQAWQTALSRFFDTGIDVAKQEPNPPSDTAWIFNPLITGTADVTAADIRWNAFPRRLLDSFGTKVAAWREGDRTRGRHEEYCEWEVVRDPGTMAVIRITFTTEVPEYYEFLLKEDSSKLLDLYHRFVSDQVKLDDLRLDNRYNPRNKWNMPEVQGKRGVLMHMGFAPNTLGAAINLAAEATWPSVDNSGNLITDEQGLIDCRGYGARERHSDPHIGAQVNALTRSGHEVSFAGPTGLYIDSVDLSRFEAPGGVKAEDLMRVVRGDQDHKMRIVFEAPSGSGFKLGDVKIDGNQIRFGGQIAEKLTIRLRAIARRVQSAAPTITCSGSLTPNAEALGSWGLTGTRRVMPEFLQSAE